ncbi:hypothetical protein DICPUDRAFT_152370 [Dictyostelium purpureum]|uniref:HAT C-terminal dimerisation domain-containing protein n=1 Tax=Dictyostelium purpureum TaxID=5786 RepID=F0ZL65_DICPU|nr:uncharacterized protein DICPUDRAFT_152370 [Dictyostelium purpureum]EGC35292.1 hypothetical protein DICPUDRAFT_152370 [Dictyostelium purpureum]|eukprot:XP_003288159.1 hypothetical protein DICPUDRAFT_152370 [Dictyostelium purpureum]
MNSFEDKNLSTSAQMQTMDEYVKTENKRIDYEGKNYKMPNKKMKNEFSHEIKHESENDNEESEDDILFIKIEDGSTPKESTQQSINQIPDELVVENGSKRNGDKNKVSLFKNKKLKKDNIMLKTSDELFKYSNLLVKIGKSMHCSILQPSQIQELKKGCANELDYKTKLACVMKCEKSVGYTSTYNIRYHFTNDNECLAAKKYREKNKMSTTPPITDNHFTKVVDTKEIAPLLTTDNPLTKAVNSPKMLKDRNCFRYAIALLICRNNLPFTLANDYFFEEIAEKLSVDKVDSIICANDIEKLFKYNKLLILNELSQVTSNVSLIIDLWSSPKGKKFMGVRCQYLTNELKVVVILIAIAKLSKKNSTADISSKIKQVAEEYQLSNKISSISLNNASHGISAVKMLCEEKIVDCSFNDSATRCFNHILNSAFTSFIKDKKKPSNITIEQLDFNPSESDLKKKYSLKSKNYKQKVPTIKNPIILNKKKYPTIAFLKESKNLPLL